MLPKRTIKRVIPGADRIHEESKYQLGEPPAAPDVSSDVIISPDTLRPNRIPPGQSRTRKWPVLDAYGPPDVDWDGWKLHIFGLIEKSFELSWADYQALPRAKVFADMHCVTRWSRLGNTWEGVSTRTLQRMVTPSNRVTHVIAYGYDSGWTTNVPIEEFFVDDALIADTHDGLPITLEHGGPARLIVPRLYAWKSAKWLRGLEFTDKDQPGFWERGGYHLHGDPWLEERYRSRWR